jgi:hypothetical protein
MEINNIIKLIHDLKRTDLSRPEKENFTFLNRETEIVSTIYFFIETLWRQKNEPTSWRGKYTIFSDQMFGSGKTYFGTHLIEQSSKHENDIFMEIQKSNSSWILPNKH